MVKHDATSCGNGQYCSEECLEHDAKTAPAKILWPCAGSCGTFLELPAEFYGQDTDREVWCGLCGYDGGR